MPIPKLSDQQLASARLAATQARRVRAEFKNKVRSGELKVIDALEQASADDVLGQIRVADLLRCIPRIGPKRAVRALEELKISPSRRVRGLGRVQHLALVEEFGDR